MANFTDLFAWFDRLGVTDSLLPFLLVFAIVFAVLQQIELFGTDKKNIHFVLALVMGLLFVIPHVTNTYPSGADPVEIINRAIPQVGIVVIAVIMVLLIVGVFGAKLDVKESPLAMVVVLLAFGLVIYIFGWAANWWGGASFPRWLGFLGNPETRAMLIILAVFLLIVFFIIGGGTKESRAKKGFGNVLDWFKSMLK
ncbi:hypothetical protein DRJ48_02825 [Candidatus Woesearchaeota archaeon]|nr:MAG: hypothetical protein DRJ48_02825 [Candidatus Woesearchaeota archaeon]